MSNKTSRHYRIREDILAELAGFVVCVNKDLDPEVKPWSETYVVEQALIFYLNQAKKRIAADKTLQAKCIDLGKSAT